MWHACLVAGGAHNPRPGFDHLGATLEEIEMCAIDFADPADVSEFVSRRACKEHKCSDCNRTILKGERYEHCSWLYDERWSREHICQHCVWAAEWLKKYCRGYVVGGIHEDLCDHWYDSPDYRTIDLARRIIGIRKGWKTRHGFLMALRIDVCAEPLGS